MRLYPHFDLHPLLDYYSIPSTRTIREHRHHLAARLKRHCCHPGPSIPSLYQRSLTQTRQCHSSFYDSGRRSMVCTNSHYSSTGLHGNTYDCIQSVESRRTPGRQVVRHITQESVLASTHTAGAWSIQKSEHRLSI